MSEVQPSVTSTRKKGSRINLQWCLLKEGHFAPIEVDQVPPINFLSSTKLARTDLLH